MLTDPYTILVEPRPFRIAYLVPQGRTDILDVLVERNRRAWGGRFNPILTTDGETVTPETWAFLRAFDPDYIVAFIKLSDELQRRIWTFLSPMHLEITRDDGPPFLSLDPLGVVPSARALAVLGQDHFRADSKFVLFPLADDTPADVRDFVIRNFGSIHGGPGSWIHDAQALQEHEPDVYRIGSVESLREALVSLASYRRVVFSSQLCTLGDSFPDQRYRHRDDDFAVIIGDDARDIAYAWNRITSVKHYHRSRFTQLWLPTSLARDASLHSALTKFLRRYVDSIGGQQYKGALFQSVSLDKGALDSLVAPLRAGLGCPAHAEQVGELPAPDFWKKDAATVRASAPQQHARGHSDEEHLLLDRPPRDLAPVGSAWFADMFVQYRPQGDTRITGRTAWWRFPAKRSLLADLRFFDRPARIRRSGIPSVLMDHQHPRTRDDGRVIVRPPSEHAVARELLCARRCDHLGPEHAAPRAFAISKPSDKGRYLEGMLRLFPGLSAAHDQFRSRLWRRVFEKLSTNDIAKSEKRLKRIYDKLVKVTAHWRTDFGRKEALEPFSRFVLEIAKEESTSSLEMTFADIRELALTEIQDYNAQHPEKCLYIASEAAKYNHDAALKRELGYLLRQQVLHIGLRPKCPSCRTRHWYRIDDVVKEITCRGCLATYALAPEEPWHYQLNSLVRAAVALHGTVPVMLVLGQLQNRTKEGSFMFAPSMDVFSATGADDESYKLEGDVDIVCLANGEFVIGEVKASVGLFNTSVFDSMLRVAKAVKPDRVFFAAFEGTRTTEIDAQLARLRAELRELETSVEWMTVDQWVHDPDPLMFELCDEPPRTDSTAKGEGATATE